MGQVIRIDPEWWYVMRMLRDSINYARDNNNLPTLRKEKETFSYVVDQLTDKNNPMTGRKAA